MDAFINDFQEMNLPGQVETIATGVTGVVESVITGKWFGGLRFFGETAKIGIKSDSILSRAEYLQQKYGHLTRQERISRIDELSRQNYTRRLTESINNQEYVFRYLSEDGLRKSLMSNNVRGYTTTFFLILPKK